MSTEEITLLKHQIDVLTRQNNEISKCIYDNNLMLFENTVKEYIELFVSYNIYDPFDESNNEPKKMRNFAISYFCRMWSIEINMYSRIKCYAKMIENNKNITDYRFDYNDHIHGFDEFVYEQIIKNHFNGKLKFDELMKCIEMTHEYLGEMFDGHNECSPKKAYTRTLKKIAKKYDIDITNYSMATYHADKFEKMCNFLSQLSTNDTVSSHQEPNSENDVDAIGHNNQKQSENTNNDKQPVNNTNRCLYNSCVMS